MAGFFHTGNHKNMTPYILERPSWSNSRIRLSWPWSRGGLSLLLDLFPQVYSCLLWATQYLAICSKKNGSYFALNPFLAYWRLNTSVQVNNMSVLHHIHTGTHMYLHHINTTIYSLLHTSSTPSGRPAAPDPSRRAQVDICPIFEQKIICTWRISKECCQFYSWVGHTKNFDEKKHWIYYFNIKLKG